MLKWTYAIAYYTFEETVGGCSWFPAGSYVLSHCFASRPALCTCVPAVLPLCCSLTAHLHCSHVQAGASKEARDQMAQHQEFFEFNQASHGLALHYDTLCIALCCQRVLCAPPVGVLHTAQPMCVCCTASPCRARRSTTWRSCTTRWVGWGKLVGWGCNVLAGRIPCDR